MGPYGAVFVLGRKYALRALKHAKRICYLTTPRHCQP